jgi:hypothetical protein
MPAVAIVHVVPMAPAAPPRVTAAFAVVVVSVVPVAPAAIPVVAVVAVTVVPVTVIPVVPVAMAVAPAVAVVVAVVAVPISVGSVISVVSVVSAVTIVAIVAVVVPVAWGVPGVDIVRIHPVVVEVLADHRAAVVVIVGAAVPEARRAAMVPTVGERMRHLVVVAPRIGVAGLSESEDEGETADREVGTERVPRIIGSGWRSDRHQESGDGDDGEQPTAHFVEPPCPVDSTNRASPHPGTRILCFQRLACKQGVGGRPADRTPVICR